MPPNVLPLLPVISRSVRRSQSIARSVPNSILSHWPARLSGRVDPFACPSRFNETRR